MNRCFDLLLTNAQVYQKGSFVLQNIGVKEGKAFFAQSEDTFNEKQDLSGFTLFPGFIDTQVHFREPGLTHKETISTGSAAAAMGGITAFLEMPNTKPATISSESLCEKLDIAKKTSYVHYAFFIGATADNLSELINAKNIPGCCGIKIFFGSSTGSLLLNDEEKILEIFKNCSLPIAIHSEDENILQENIEIRNQAKSVHAHYHWRSAESALSSTKILLRLARKAGKKIHILHITTQEEIELLLQNRDIATFEVTPQHLFFSAPTAYDELGTKVQMNPPIREEKHRKALWQAFIQNQIDVIGSDHAPHTLEEKQKAYPESPSGMPGVQTIAPLLLHFAIEQKISFEYLVKVLVENPVKIYQLEGKGKIENGFDADFTLVDLKGETLILDSTQKSQCAWTPFHNKKLKGKVKGTMIAGKWAMFDDELTLTHTSKKLTRIDQ
jgi:dihydroorotase